MIPLTHLRRVAEAATPGKWHREKLTVWMGGEDESGLQHLGMASLADNAEFIATFNPALVSLLLDVAKTLERLIEAASEFAVSAVVGAAELMDEDEDKLNIALNDARRALATLAAATPEASDD